MSAEWTIKFFEDARYPESDDRRRPVEHWLDALPLTGQARVRAAALRLAAYNLRATEPLVKHVDGPLWELRIPGGDAYRVVYGAAHEKRFVLLHGFTKKTQRMPPRELAAARKIYAQFLAQEQHRPGETG